MFLETKKPNIKSGFFAITEKVNALLNSPFFISTLVC